MKTQTIYRCKQPCPENRQCIIIRNPTHDTDGERIFTCPVMTQAGKTPQNTENKKAG